MQRSIAEKLRELGLDNKFLEWLEGEEDRLPRLGAVKKIKGDEFAAAIRAANWLAQCFTDRTLIAPHTSEDWDQRYMTLEAFLVAALRWSGVYQTLNLHRDLEALESVLSKLLPKASRDIYTKDILLLRQRCQPPRLPEMPRQRSGGSPPKEQTLRMRAALEYISSKSRRPYADLADFWNECLGAEKYHPDEIKARLRKGPPTSLGKGYVKHWQRVYAGDMSGVFPGPFPMGPDLFPGKKPTRRQSTHPSRDVC